VEPEERAEQIWAEMLSHEGVAVFVSRVDAKIVATCMLITAPNLLRDGRHTGFSKMSSLIRSFGVKAMGVRWCALRLLQHGRRTVITPSKWPHRRWGASLLRELRLRAPASDRLRCAPSKPLIPALGPNRRHALHQSSSETVAPATPFGRPVVSLIGRR
jgi:hypothetical protein